MLFSSPVIIFDSSGTSLLFEFPPPKALYPISILFSLVTSGVITFSIGEGK